MILIDIIDQTFQSIQHPFCIIIANLHILPAFPAVKLKNTSQPDSRSDPVDLCVLGQLYPRLTPRSINRPMLAGTYGGEEVSLSKMFEAVGAYKAGMITDEQLEDCTCNCCPSCGSCSGMYTANSMNCLCEAIGIALPGNGTIPAVYSKRLQLAKHAGMAVMEMVRKGITARQIINERSIRNALTCDMALGCSTNTVLHLLAIAYEAGVPIDLKLFNEISAKTPNLCHLAPAGPTHMPDLYAAGGIPAVQAELAKKGLLDLEVVWPSFDPACAGGALMDLPAAS